MAYLGNAPARSFISFEKQVFTIVNSQTAYTLSHSVNNENDIRLVINNIVQEPGSGKAYTASGTTLTLSAALTNGTDEMYCVFLGRATATNAPGAGSVGTSQLASDAVTEAKIADDAVESEHLNNNVISGQTALGAEPADTDEFLVSDAGTIKRVDYSYIKGAGAGESNDPSFHVYNPQNGSVATSTSVVVSHNTELFDSSSAYDTSTYRFTPQVGGYYYFYASVRFQSSTNAFDRINVAIRKNGTEMISGRNDNTDYSTTHVSGIILANGSSDYFDMTAYHTRGSNLNISTEDELVYFGGFLIKKT